MLRLCVCLLIAGSLSAQSLAPVEERIAQAIDARKESGITLLERLVNINSGTLNLKGVEEVGRVLRPELEKLGFTVQWIPMAETKRAGHLIAERRGTHGKKVLLIGHLDTVFEPSSPFQKFERQGDQATGPGTSDMKGGLIVMLQALQGLHEAGALEGTSSTVVLTGDEEKPGEPLSIARRDLIAAGKRNDVALEFEGGSPLGWPGLRNH